MGTRVYQFPIQANRMSAPLPPPGPPPASMLDPPGEGTGGKWKGKPFHPFNDPAPGSKVDKDRLIDFALKTGIHREGELVELTTNLTKENRKLNKTIKTLLQEGKDNLALSHVNWNALLESNKKVADLDAAVLRLGNELKEAKDARDAFEKQLKEAKENAEKELLKVRSGHSELSSTLIKVRADLSNSKLELARLSAAAGETISSEVRELQEKLLQLRLQVANGKLDPDSESDEGGSANLHEFIEIIAKSLGVPERVSVAGDPMNIPDHETSASLEARVLAAAQSAANGAAKNQGSEDECRFLEDCLRTVMDSVIRIVKTLFSDAHTTDVSDCTALQDFFACALFLMEDDDVKRMRKDGSPSCKDGFRRLRDKIKTAGKVHVADLVGCFGEDVVSGQIVSALWELSEDLYPEATQREVATCLKSIWGVGIPSMPTTTESSASSSASPTTPAPSPTGKPRKMKSSPSASRGTPPSPMAPMPRMPSGSGSSPSLSGRVARRVLTSGSNALHIVLHRELLECPQDINWAIMARDQAVHGTFFTRMREGASDGGLNPVNGLLAEYGASRDSKNGNMLLDLTLLFHSFSDSFTAADLARVADFDGVISGTYNMPIATGCRPAAETIKQWQAEQLDKVNEYIVARGGKAVPITTFAHHAKKRLPMGEGGKHTWVVLLVGAYTGSSTRGAGQPYDIPRLPSIWFGRFHGPVTV